MTTVAALYVQPRGVYSAVEGVEPWGLPERDARLYDGPWPVVAHPPCARWCRLAGLVEARWGHKRGEDGGTFAAALAAVRRWGGVLEHPAYTDAWAAYGLPAPPAGGGWQRGICGGWACHVEQWHYGHAAKKATWLYAFGVAALPSLEWSRTPDGEAALVERCGGRGRPALVSDGGVSVARRRTAPISWCGNHVASTESRRRLGKREASSTPLPFRDVMLAIARSGNEQLIAMQNEAVKDLL